MEDREFNTVSEYSYKQYDIEVVEEVSTLQNTIRRKIGYINGDSIFRTDKKDKLESVDEIELMLENYIDSVLIPSFKKNIQLYCEQYLESDKVSFGESTITVYFSNDISIQTEQTYSSKEETIERINEKYSNLLKEYLEKAIKKDNYKKFIDIFGQDFANLVYKYDEYGEVEEAFNNVDIPVLYN